MSKAVLDASAILAVVFDEPGAEKVEPLLPEAVVSAINLAEVVTKFFEYGMPEDIARTIVEGLQMDIRPFGSDHSYAVAGLRAKTRHAGLSIGDRACLALAKELGVPAVTADRIWMVVGEEIGVEIQCIR